MGSRRWRWGLQTGLSVVRCQSGSGFDWMGVPGVLIAINMPPRWGLELVVGMSVL